MSAQDGPFQAYPMVLVRHPEQGPAFATVGYAGEVGAITGYSEHDIAISEKVWDHYKGQSSWRGMPTTFALRDILQFGENLETAIAKLKTTSRTNS